MRIRITYWLTALWLGNPARRQAITGAQAAIDRLLEADPLGNGHHLSEGLYRLRVPPLSVTFTVDVPARRVEINSVSLIP